MMETKITLPSGFVFDAANMLGEGLITAAMLDELAPSIQAAAEAVEKIRKTGEAKNHLSKDGTSEPVYFPRLPFPGKDSPNTPELLQELTAFGEKARKDADAVIFCGIGGSYLGGKVLYDCCTSAYWPGEHKKDLPRIYFSGNNVDPEDLEGIKASLIESARKMLQEQHRTYRVLLVPISKSGTTLETTTAFLYFYQELSSLDTLFTISGAMVTDKNNAEAPLNQLARQFAWPIFDVPVGVGGRFSVLSEPGLVVGAVLGMDLEALLTGARDMDQCCHSDALAENPALFNATLKYAGAKYLGATIEIIMPYAMRLKALGEWYVQLLAESLGKRKDRDGNTVFYGRTPVVAIGTTDMHAQTQMHQDGRRDKIVQFLFVESRKNRVKTHNPFPALSVYKRYEGMDVGRALEVAMEANQAALSGDKRLNALYRVPRIDEYFLGQIFYFLMLSIAYEGELANVDAYDQPGVEVYKKIMNRTLAEGK